MLDMLVKMLECDTWPAICDAIPVPLVTISSPTPGLLMNHVAPPALHASCYARLSAIHHDFGVCRFDDHYLTRRSSSNLGLKKK